MLKLDAPGRDRADDLAIGLAIHQAGATLVSASGAVDDSPSGTLLHGIIVAMPISVGGLALRSCRGAGRGKAQADGRYSF